MEISGKIMTARKIAVAENAVLACLQKVDDHLEGSFCLLGLCTSCQASLEGACYEIGEVLNAHGAPKGCPKEEQRRKVVVDAAIASHGRA